MATSRICSIPDCGKKVQAAYLCAMHLWRLKKYGSTAAPPLKSRPKCVVSDCARMSGLAHDANGLCAYHLRRLRRSGTTGVVIADDGAPQRFIAEALQSQTDAASNAFWSWLWLIIMLCTLEGARSLSLWALITDISSSDAKRDREWTDELAALRHQRERAAIIAETNAAVAAYAAPPPVETPPAPEPIPEPEPMVLDEIAPPVEPELTPAQQRGRAGGLATAQARKANRAKTERLILVPSFVARDAEAAAKVAAE